MVNMALPEGWKKIKLRDIGNFYKGKGISNEDKGSGNIPCLTYGEIYTTHNEYIKEFRSFISKDIAQNAYKLKKGDLLFTCSGETKEEIGKTVAFMNEFEAYAGGDIIIFSPQMNIDSFFMGFLLNTSYVVRQKANYGQGDSIVHISKDSLEKIIVNLPPLPEQQAIAKILTETDKLIALKERLIAAKQKQKQWLMQKLLTGEIRLSGFQDEWEYVRLGETFRVLPSLPLSRAELTDTGYCYLHYGDIHKMERFSIEPSFYADKPRANVDELKDDLLLKDGDVVFVDASEDYEGVCKYVVIKNNKNIPFISGLHTIHLRSTNTKMDNDFKEFCFQNSKTKKQMVIRCTGMKVYGLSKAEVLNLQISLPPLPEQKAIADVLTTADREIELLSKELEQQNLIKKYLMQQLLTGKIRVKGV